MAQTSKIFFLLIVIFFTYIGKRAKAQAIPDNTLGSESSTINSTNELRSLIEGGAIRGENLFHSFEKFSVIEGFEIYFANPKNITNIFSRVTGNDVSEIFGTLGVEGTANLFFINPNGIIFGEKARLDVGSSFVATTANSVDFADGMSFLVKDNNPDVSLTVHVPVGLGFYSNNGNIIVRGTGHDLRIMRFSPTINPETKAGLQVAPDSTLALIGGNIILDGATLKARSGQIELGSVSSQSNVGLDINSSGSIVNYEGVSSFGDIQFLNKSLVDASSINNDFNSGNIKVFGGNLTITDGSVLLIQQQGLTQGGSLEINASESLFIAGADPLATMNGFRINSSLRNENLGIGKNGKTQIFAKEITLRDGGQILNLSFGSGTGGNINISASDTVEIMETSRLDPIVNSVISTSNLGSGDAGDLRLSTKNLKIAEGGNIVSVSFGSGKGGNIFIDSTNSIEIIGVEPNFLFPSLIGANAFNLGNAGNITINTSNLIVQEGGRIDSSTVASGSSGNITINTFESIKVDGTVNGTPTPSSIISAGNIVTEDIQQILRLPPIPSGNAGSVIINTPNLNITNGAAVGVQNFGTGDAGSLEINSDFINLNNAGNITASTLSGDGGNLTLTSENIQLNNSNISASAGGQGDGGNITVNSDIVTVLDNSSITANAEEGNGGNVNITAKGSFVSPDSTIAATSELGIDGEVNIETLSNDIEKELTPSELSVEDLSVEIAKTCLSNQRATFKEGSTTGLPLNSDSDHHNLDFSLTGFGSIPVTPSEENPTSFDEESLIPATHMIETPDGETYLVSSLQEARDLICSNQ